jgi:hypothetical protein
VGVLAEHVVRLAKESPEAGLGLDLPERLVDELIHCEPLVRWLSTAQARGAW